MTEQNEGGSTIEWGARAPDVIHGGFWDDNGFWNDISAWQDDPMWTEIATGDRTD